MENLLVSYINIDNKVTDSNEILSRNARSAAELVKPSNGKKYINLLLEKLLIKDANIKKTVDYEFEYFTVNITPNEFVTYNNGTILKGINNNDYYIIQNESVVKIPNKKTVEVLLNERGKTIDSIIVLETSDLEKILQSNNGKLTLSSTNKGNASLPPASGGGGGGGGGGSSSSPPEPEPLPIIEDKSNEWNESMTQLSLSEVFNSLLSTVTSAQTIADEAIATSQQTIDLAIADASLAKQESATAQESAAAAIASAQQAEAEAQLLTSDQVGTLNVVIDDVNSLKDRVSTLESK